MSPDMIKRTGQEILNPLTIIAAARQQTGLNDFGDERFIEPLRQWLEALANESPLTEAGVAMLQDLALSHLKTRLRVNEFVKRHPEIRDEDVSDPIVIVGLPRTGTTKLQRILSLDPKVQGLPFWQLLNPVPIGSEKIGEVDQRLALATVMIEGLKQHFPEFYAGHQSMATEPEEEIFALEFDTQLCCGRAYMPSYVQWWLHRSRAEQSHVYDYLRLLLQSIQWQNGGRKDRPFIMKSPMHLGNFPFLLQAFPKATVVHTHRNVATAIASVARILELMILMASDNVRLKELGDHILSIYIRDLNQSIADRQLLAGKLDIVDVAYDEVCNDSLKVIRDIWRHRGRTLSLDEESLFRGWELDHPQYQFGSHKYSLDQYGITPERLARAAAPYLAAFPASSPVP